MNGKFYVSQLRQLVGAKVVSVAVDDSDDEQFFGLILQCPDGAKKLLWLLRDDEGNGPGSFSIEDTD